jgi:predicted dehydrogenase
MTKTCIALVGFGMAVTPHTKGLLDLKDRVEVVYTFSPRAKRREAFGARFPFPLCDRLETIMDDRSIDAVGILTPANSHLEIARRAAAAGKHVLLESPWRSRPRGQRSWSKPAARRA